MVEGVAEIAKSIKLGPGIEPDTQMGPLVSDEQLRRVTGYLEPGKAEGATALSGGGRHGDRGYFVEQTELVVETKSKQSAAIPLAPRLRDASGLAACRSPLLRKQPAAVAQPGDLAVRPAQEVAALDLAVGIGR